MVQIKDLPVLTMLNSEYFCCVSISYLSISDTITDITDNMNNIGDTSLKYLLICKISFF